MLATCLLAVLVGGCGIAAQVGAVEATRYTKVSVRPMTLAPIPPPVPAALPTPAVTPEESLDYFIEVAFGFEYGGGPREVRKWSSDPRIGVHGAPTPEDLATLVNVVADLNAIIDTVNIDIVESGANVELHFAPEPKFADIVPSYVPGNSGYFWVWWEGGGHITSGRVLVSTDVNQPSRNHLIREEITQMLGLGNDSSRYPDSIFYGPRSSTQRYSELDEEVIKLLYRPEITAGLTVEEALAVIGT